MNVYQMNFACWICQNLIGYFLKIDNVVNYKTFA